MEGSNDNDTFQSLAVATAKALAKIEDFEEARKVDNAEEEKAAGDKQERRKERDGEHERYVIRRLRDLAGFERRARGKGFKR